LVINGDIIPVSRVHAEIIEKDGELYLRDRGSSNGTFINSGQIQGEALLKSGDRIYLSQAFSFKIEFA
jgi:pSer/pThr/pTyr-binding forkhead associated (FHA) protein